MSPRPEQDTAMGIDKRAPIVIPDDARTDGIEGSVYPSEYEGHFQSLMITREQILNRIKVLADFIHDDYGKSRPVMVCVLKGANPFYQNLLEALQELRQGYTMEFLRVSSYVGTQSTGNVTIGDGFRYEAIRGQHVILIEDIVDTGTTLSHVIPILEKEGAPKSIQVCTLLEKRLNVVKALDAKYKGFSIPNQFIVGYGLDYNQLYRDVRDIWVISQAGIIFHPSALSSDSDHP